MNGACRIAAQPGPCRCRGVVGARVRFARGLPGPVRVRPPFDGAVHPRAGLVRVEAEGLEHQPEEPVALEAVPASAPAYPLAAIPRIPA